MKILDQNAGMLTNFEVLNLLRSRGATIDPLGSLGVVSASECKVYSFLADSAACNQTRECIGEFLKRCEKFKLSKTELLNIINLRPSSQPLIYPLIRNCDTRLAKNEDEGIDEVQELVDLVKEVLPPPPANNPDNEEEVKTTEIQQEMQDNKMTETN
ncbi:RNA polymerase subunit RPB4/RPC9 protein [Dioscorea alata]|uniref:RNA polymerase subunit RPB4/RPC9 protein n=3 Tax=Dioscorea alata TaxID=55571 RepID=A0ACB7TYJ6_DIOAL|nr:RNA polymerase subunit RPB4/RPC9 protein [Dioscorea alata]